VTVTVAPVNDTPIAVDDMATTDEEVAVVSDVLANDTDPDGDPLTIVSVRVVCASARPAMKDIAKKARSFAARLIAPVTSPPAMDCCDVSM